MGSAFAQPSQTTDKANKPLVVAVKPAPPVIIKNADGSYPDISIALWEQLAAGTVIAVVYDAPLLRYELQQREGKNLRVLPFQLEKQTYGFAFPEASRLQETVNRDLLRFTASQDWRAILEWYLGQG